MDFNWAVSWNRATLRLMGIWPIDQKNGSRYSRVRVPFMILVIFFGLFVPQCHALTLVVYHLPLVIDNFMTTSPAMVSCMKLYFIWRQTKVLRPVLKSMSRDWVGAKRDWEHEIMRSAAEKGRLVTIVDYIVMAVCYCGFVVAPLIGFDLRLINGITDYGARTLLVQSYYPFDYSATPTFELAYTLQFLGSFFVGLAVSVLDDYYVALLYHASAQFQILGIDIQHLLRDGAKDIGDFDRRLRTSIDRHVHLIGIVSAIEKAFGFVIAAQIFCMSTMICCLGFQILGILDVADNKPTALQIITLTGTLVTMMLHTLVHCLTSEILAFRSADIFYKIYCSEWYTLPWRKRRYLVPMMLVSSVTRQIKAGYILRMSLVTYCGIIKSTAGYISVLIAASKRGR
ncbi:uncharacterized protein LOC106647268 [Copidosoma floridanum]|uniref:uncharacterized protein LOC106647268 n=1 Tax=Copidosoma floridanum TaxID=29053 RepID=UPI000C6FA543|nr:uncharacterized protein LOC106647268 [Copidosoma floridanum]